MSESKPITVEVYEMPQTPRTVALKVEPVPAPTLEQKLIANMRAYASTLQIGHPLHPATVLLMSCVGDNASLDDAFSTALQRLVKTANEMLRAMASGLSDDEYEAANLPLSVGNYSMLRHLLDDHGAEGLVEWIAKIEQGQGDEAVED